MDVKFDTHITESTYTERFEMYMIIFGSKWVVLTGTWGQFYN
jgi:hypothetical protein